MTFQATIFDFQSKALPLKGWSHENGGRGWIYRSNAEAVIKALGKLPSGAGLWPRLMATPKGRWPDERGDLLSWNHSGNGGIHKVIRFDGTVRDEICIDYSHGLIRIELRQAWLDGDLMHVIGEDGIERTLEVHEDSECSHYDIHPFDPARDPEHYLMLAMLKGVRGDTARAMSDMPYDFSVCAPRTEAMDAVWSTVELTHVIPMCDQSVPLAGREGCRWPSRCPSWVRCP